MSSSSRFVATLLFSTLVPLLLAVSFLVIDTGRRTDESALMEAQDDLDSVGRAAARAVQFRMEGLENVLDGLLVHDDLELLLATHDEAASLRLQEFVNRLSSGVEGVTAIELHDESGRGLAAAWKGSPYSPEPASWIQDPTSGRTWLRSEGAEVTRLARSLPTGERVLFASALFETDALIGPVLNSAVAGMPNTAIWMELGRGRLNTGRGDPEYRGDRLTNTTPLESFPGEIHLLQPTDSAVRKLRGSMAPVVAVLIGLLASLIPLWVMSIRSARPGQVALKAPTEQAEAEFPVSSVNFLSDVQEELISQLQQRLKSAQAELSRLRKRKQSALRSKSELLSNMNYETRTAVNAIIGMSRMLLDTDLSVDQRDHVQTLRDSAESLLLVLNDNQDYARIEANALVLFEREFSIVPCIDEVLDIVYPRAMQKGIEVSCFLEPQVPERIQGDEKRFRRILMNLVSNGIRLTTEGEVAIEVSTESELRLAEDEESHAKLQITVRNTGSGTSSTGLDDLFHFHGFGGSSARSESGVCGGSLAVSRRIAQLMGGEITVEEDGEGGFAFRLEVVIDAPEQAGDSSRRRERRFVGVNAMVVDVSENNRRVIGGVAEAWKINLGEASDGSSALEMMRAASKDGDPYEVVLINPNLRGMEGERLIKRIAEDPTLDPARLIVIGDCMNEEQTQRLGALGVKSWLSKPVRPSGVENAILSALDSSPSTVEAISSAQNLDVLLVEDDYACQKTVGLMLRGLGANVDVASTGEEAVEAVALKCYDIILMHCRRPVLNGIKAAAKIRQAQDTHSARVPIVAMTAYVLEVDRERCMKAGLDDYVPMPLHMAELGVILDRWRLGKAKNSHSDRRRSMQHSRRGEILDPDVIASLKEACGEDDPDLLIEVVDLFLNSTPDRLEAVRQALDEQDWTTLEMLSDSIKTSCAQLGALRLSRVCDELECLARGSRDLEEAQLLVDRSLTEFDRVQSALEKLDA